MQCVSRYVQIVTLTFALVSAPPLRSGRFLATDYFMILEGEQWAMRPGEFTRRVFLPGELNVLPQGESIQYKMPGMS